MGLSFDKLTAENLHWQTVTLTNEQLQPAIFMCHIRGCSDLRLAMLMLDGRVVAVNRSGGKAEQPILTCHPSLVPLCRHSCVTVAPLRRAPTPMRTRRHGVQFHSQRPSWREQGVQREVYKSSPICGNDDIIIINTSPCYALHVEISWHSHHIHVVPESGDRKRQREVISSGTMTEGVIRVT